MDSSQEIVLFINVTKQCNVNCPRCYLTEVSRKTAFVLPVNLFEKLLSSSHLDGKKVTVIFEGGEVTLIGERQLMKYIDAVVRIRPEAKMTAVSNFLSLPSWFIDICHKHFGSIIETTFAFDNKFTLNGSRDKFLSKFERGMQKAKENNISFVVNVELNIETIKCGPSLLFALIEKTGHTKWEFDISLDFDEFNHNQVFNEFGYPVVKSTASYMDFSQYIKSLYHDYGDKLKSLGFESTISKRSEKNGDKNMSFNVQMEDKFITINPDGTITSNPLFSDMPKTYLGNIERTSLEDMINGSILKNRIKHEKRRVLPCYSCQYFKNCKGGPAHASLYDGSGECAGSKQLWEYFR